MRSRTKILLAYASKDRDIVEQTRNYLSVNGCVVWLLETDPYIAIDSRYREAETVLLNTDFCIACLSTQSINKEGIYLVSTLIEQPTSIISLRLEVCEIPAFMMDLQYFDWWDIGSRHELLHTLDAEGQLHIEWTDTGPRIIGRGLQLSPREVSVLVNRCQEYRDKFISQQKEMGDSVDDRVTLLAIASAFHEVYGSVPDVDTLRTLSTESACKFDLFFEFLMRHISSNTRRTFTYPVH